MKKILTVRWQRLVDEAGSTCPRCGKTGEQVEKAVVSLSRRLKPRGIAVCADPRELSWAAFNRRPSSSNRIWIAGKPLEEWLSAKSGRSQCCGSCGTAACRTLEVRGKAYESVPARLIVEAGMTAARLSFAGKRAKPVRRSLGH